MSPYPIFVYQEFPMSGALTKMNENFNHRFHRFTQIFLFSAFSASLRFVISAGEMKMPDETMIRIMQTCHTIAVVGFSRYPAKAGYYVPAYLQKQGYRIIPVNPNLEEGLGETAYDSLEDIPEPVDLVLLFQRSENVPSFVEQAVAIGAKAVWMQLGIEHAAAAATARMAGLDVVQNTCLLVVHRHWTGR